jgi:hypothetical protein
MAYTISILALVHLHNYCSIVASVHLHYYDAIATSKFKKPWKFFQTRGDRMEKGEDRWTSLDYYSLLFNHFISLLFNHFISLLFNHFISLLFNHFITNQILCMFSKRLSEPTNSTQALFTPTKKKEDQPSFLDPVLNQSKDSIFEQLKPNVSTIEHTNLFQVDQAPLTNWAHWCTNPNQGSALLGPSPKKGKSFIRHFCVFPLDFRIQSSTNEKTPFGALKVDPTSTADSVWESRSHDPLLCTWSVHMERAHPHTFGLCTWSALIRTPLVCAHGARSSAHLWSVHMERAHPHTFCLCTWIQLILDKQLSLLIMSPGTFPGSTYSL